MPEQDELRRSILEQHIGTILQVMVVGLLGWSLATTVELRTDIGILKAKMEAVQTTLSQGTNDRYHGTDAARDFKGVWNEIQRLEARVDKCEGKLNK
jgi:hypothetical protein